MLLIFPTSVCKSPGTLCASDVDAYCAVRHPDQEFLYQPGEQAMKQSMNALAVIMLLATSMAASAQGFDGSPEMRGKFADPERLVQHLSRRLDLDDTQQQALANVVDAAAPEMSELRESARANRDAIRELDVNDPDYDAKLSNLARENGELASTATLLHGRLRAEMNALLTPEQRETLANLPKRSGKRGHDQQKQQR
jgi:protein CpxP